MRREIPHWLYLAIIFALLLLWHPPMPDHPTMTYTHYVYDSNGLTIYKPYYPYRDEFSMFNWDEVARIQLM